MNCISHSHLVLHDDAPPPNRPLHRPRQPPRTPRGVRSVKNFENQVWLDYLPLEARSKIAWFLSSGKQSEDVRMLGLVSKHQKEAVVEALLYTYTADPESSVFSVEWAGIFKNAIRCLVTNVYRPNIHHYYALDPLFRAKSLREIRFNGMDTCIIPFLSVCSLRKVIVYFKYTFPPWPVTEVALAVRAKHFTIVCESDGGCALQHMGMMSMYCTHFESVGFKCCCRDTGLWYLLRTIRNVSEVTFSAAPPPDVWQYINNIENIQIVRNTNVWGILPQVKWNVTQVGPVTLSSPEEAATIDQCGRLTSFECMIKKGAEIGFLDVAKTLSSLRKLKLYWYRDGSCVLCELNGPASVDHIHYAAPGAVSNLVRHAPNIVEFELYQVLLKLDEMICILKFLGNRLRFFSCTVRYEGERKLRYLAAVQKALHMYNPRVSTAKANTFLFTAGMPLVKTSM